MSNKPDMMAFLAPTDADHPSDIPYGEPYSGLGQKPPRRCLLTLVVMGMTSCVCLMTIALSGLGGYQDESRVIRTEEAQTRVAEVATQWQLAQNDEAIGLLDIAADRYEFIATQQPGNREALNQLNRVRVMLSYTPTPSPTQLPSATPTEEVIPPTPTLAQVDVSPSPTTGVDLQAIYDEAVAWHEASLDEKAIELLNIIIQLDPNFRRVEVSQMLFTSLKRQAMRYFRALNTNEDLGYPGDQLARGVLLADQAIAIHAQNPSVGSLTVADGGNLQGERNFVNSYITARDFVNGGRYAEARPILEELCNWNCGWGYGGITVQNLLDRALAGN